MISFKCKRSGNTVSFEKESDIQAMRKESGYVEVVLPPVLQLVVEKQAEVVPQIKKMGRPKKNAPI